MLLFCAFLYGVVGLGLEVIETALLDLPSAKDKALMGFTSVWYFPFYAVAPLAYFHFLHEPLFALPLLARAVVYPLSFWAIEYPSMALLRLILGKSPSEESYRRKKWGVHGLIRLDLAPVWMCFGFVFEWMYRWLGPLLPG